MKTPALDAPMTEAETLEAFGAWNAFKVSVAGRAPSNMLELLESLSPIVDEVFTLRKQLNAIWQRAEDRHYGRLDVIKPFRRGVSPKSAPIPKKKGSDLLKELGITEEQLDDALSQLNLLSPPQGGPEESNT